MPERAIPDPIVMDRSNWRGRAIVPVLVFIGLLSSVVSSLGAPLVPTIATDYGVAVGSAQWSLTLTLLIGGVLAPVVGRLGDGPRRLPVLLTALGILVLGSVLAALPTGFVLLLLGRGMQGVGMALLPLTMSVARDHLAPDRSRTTLATLSVTTVVGIGLGYPLTGLIAEHLGFHTGFWLAAGLGLIAMLLAALVVPNSVHRPRESFDLPGAVLLGFGIAGLLVGVSEGGQWGWTSPRLLLLVVVSLALLAAWSYQELRVRVPMVNLRLMANRTVMTANISGLLAGIGMYALMSMVVRYVQTPTSIDYGLGATVVVAGLALVPMSVGSFGASKAVAAAGRWIRPERILPLGALIFTAGCLIFAAGRSQLWEIFVVMAFVGLGTGCSFAVMPRMIVGAVPDTETGSALAMNQVVRNIGYATGSALSATILSAHTFAPAVLPTNRGYTVGALVATAMCLLTAAVAWLLTSRGRTTGTLRRLDDDQELVVEENVDAAIAGVVTLEPDDAQAETEAPAGRHARVPA